MSAGQRLRDIATRAEENNRKQALLDKNRIAGIRSQCGDELHLQVQKLLLDGDFDAAAEHGKRELWVPARLLLTDKCWSHSESVLSQYVKQHPQVNGVSLEYTYPYGSGPAGGLNFQWK